MAGKSASTLIPLIPGFGIFFFGTAAAVAEHAPSIPEPMVFDLVRPLGARQGELEVNTLGQRTHRSGAPWAWAPEVEYAFADGYSAELEFPIEDGSLKQYKAAVQGTFGPTEKQRFIHGWQAIGRRSRNESSWSADMLHLAGYRLNSSWSTFFMNGVRRSKLTGTSRWAAVSNPSVFRDLGQRWTAGVEVNLVIGHSPVSQQLAMPQAQVRFGAGWILQAGAGMERTASSAARPAIAIRITRVLR